MPPESPQCHAAHVGGRPSRVGGALQAGLGLCPSLQTGWGRGKRWWCTNFPRPSQETHLKVKGTRDRSVNYMNVYPRHWMLEINSNIK